ncbi:MAG: hypothetical protein IPJ82_13320 [Lewinellaceae bacterium]|nr:hypothetical protein [Lewinellaceae bacterium]
MRYNGIIVKIVNNNYEKTLGRSTKNSPRKVSIRNHYLLQNEGKIAPTDSALVKAEEQALFIASINLDKAGQLVKEAVLKVDSLQDIPGAIAVLDNEMLYQVYLEASEKKKKADVEIQQVVEGFV